MNEPRDPSELTAELRTALARMLDVEPSPTELKSSLERLQSHGPSPYSFGVERPSRRDDSGRRRWIALAVACSVVFVTCLVASTDAWAQVTRDYSLPSHEPRPITTLADSSNSATVEARRPALGVRIVLLSHVLSLLLGLSAMAATWIIVTCKRLLALRAPAKVTCGQRSLEYRLLSAGFVLYAAGVLLGCLWSQLTWGSPWRWDPKEVFCLFTVSVSALWMGLAGGSRSATPSRFQLAADASLTTIAFGTIFLMIPIASNFAAAQHVHSYGFAFTGLPTLLTGIVVFFACWLAIVWLAWLRASNLMETR